MKANTYEVGQRIKNIRKSKGLTMVEFGELIQGVGKSAIANLEKGVGKSAIANWEKGLNLPNNERLKRIATLGEVSMNELLYGSLEKFRYSIIRELFNLNMIDSNMKENNIELYKFIGGSDFINEVYEQVEKENLGYNDRDEIAKVFKMKYNLKVFGFFDKESSEKEKLNNAINTVNLNLALEYYERETKLDNAIKENELDNAKNFPNMVIFDHTNFEQVPTIMLDDENLNEHELSILNKAIEQIRNNRNHANK